MKSDLPLSKYLREHNKSMLWSDITRDVWLFGDPHQPSRVLAIPPYSVPVMLMPGHSYRVADWNAVQEAAAARIATLSKV